MMPGYGTDRRGHSPRRGIAHEPGRGVPRFPPRLCLSYRVSLYTRVMTKAISVRLDEDVQRALATLEAAGISRSDAIRKAILDAASVAKRHAALRREVAALERDEMDREEMRSVATMMEALRAPE